MRRLSRVPGTAGFRGRMASSVVFGKVLYGLEAQRVTEVSVRATRGVLAGGILQRLGLRRAAAAPLLLDVGRFDPAVVYAKRLYRSRVRTLSLDGLPEDYLRAMPGMKGWRGPVQGAYARFRALGVRMKEAACLILGGASIGSGRPTGLRPLSLRRLGAGSGVGVLGKDTTMEDFRQAEMMF